jgi:hypothetical protein
VAGEPGRDDPTIGGGSGFAITALVLGIVGVALGLVARAIDYELPLLLGILALTFGIIGVARRSAGRGMAIAGAILGVLALALGLVGYSMVNEAFEGLENLGGDVGGTEPSASEQASAERDEFCDSEDGDVLARASSAPSDTGAELRATTRTTLRAASDAPPGAFCAVSALDSVASSWNLFADSPGFSDAEAEVRRIRRFQRENDLRRPEY